MATKLAKRIVGTESPIEMTESFAQAMKDRAKAICEGLRKEFAERILLENSDDVDYDNKLDSAIDYTFRYINTFGLEKINEGVKKASSIFGIEKADLENMFESSLETEEIDELQKNDRSLFEDFEINFLSGLDNIIENGSGNILAFKDATSAYITPEEGEKLLEVYSQLNDENKKKMVENLTEGKQKYQKVLEFSMNSGE